jgi:uncharacterized membrane protein
MVYAYAALQLASKRYAKASMWQKLAMQLQAAKDQAGAASVACDQLAPRRARSFKVI